MTENSWYSVISPENCSAILWRNWEHKETAATALNLTADNMLDNGLIDSIVKEPIGGAHADHDKMFALTKKAILKNLEELLALDVEERISQRIEKFCKMGSVSG